MHFCLSLSSARLGVLGCREIKGIPFAEQGEQGWELKGETSCSITQQGAARQAPGGCFAMVCTKGMLQEAFCQQMGLKANKTPQIPQIWGYLSKKPSAHSLPQPHGVPMALFRARTQLCPIQVKAGAAPIWLHPGRGGGRLQQPSWETQAGNVLLHIPAAGMD